MARTTDVAQLRLGFVDHIQWRYEVIRPVVLLRDTTPQQRAHEMHTHPFTVRRLMRQFQARGMLGLLPRGVEVGGTRGTPRVSDAIRPELHRLKALYDGFPYRELARILFIKCRQPIDHTTVKAIWQASPVSPDKSGRSGGTTMPLQSGASRQASQPSDTTPFPRPTVAALRVSLHRIRSASFPTGVKDVGSSLLLVTTVDTRR